MRLTSFFTVSYYITLRVSYSETIEDFPQARAVIKLQKDGVEIGEVDVGEFFDIYVEDSTDDTDIKQVRFSSDDSRTPNNVLFTWVYRFQK